MPFRIARLARPSTEALVTSSVVAVAVLLVFWQLQPNLLFMNTLTAGGDMGAHTWLPWYVKHHLLPHGRISGWTPDWYAGFPALTFYFPLPSLLVVALSYVLPYGVAFKLVTVSGMCSLPIAGWAFGRLARMPFPAPACLAAATVPFLFDTGYTILGGNMASTLAGEYAFSIALSLAMVFLGLVAGGLETGRRRAAAAVVLALVITCHILPTIFAIVGGALLVLLRMAGGALPTVRRWRTLLVGLVGLLVIGRAVVAVVHWSRIVEALLLGVLVAAAVLLAPAPRRLRLRVRGVDDGGRGGADVTTLRRAILAEAAWSLPLGGLGAGLALFWLVGKAIGLGVDVDGYGFVGVLLLAAVALALGLRCTPVRPAKAPEGRWWWGPRLSALRWAVPVGVVALLLSGYWSVPFVLRSTYMNDMGWEKIGVGVQSGMQLYDQVIVHYVDALFPHALEGVQIAAAVGGAVSLYLRRRIGIFFVLVAVTSFVAFVEMPQGRLWNARLLPFWYLSCYMLAGLLLSELGRGLASALWRVPSLRSSAPVLRWMAAPLALALALGVVVPKIEAPGWWPVSSGFPWHDPATQAPSFISGWATWNYAGYDGKKPDGTLYKPANVEYQAVMRLLQQAGDREGCGRVMWEYESTLDRFGTPMALMLSPLHTKGCMGSMEGLFFESSATVPYHFLNQTELSVGPSQAMRDLPYGSLDVADGISKLQLMGVKYYLTFSPTVQAQADLDPRLTLVGTTPASAAQDGSARTWKLYAIAGSDLVTGVDNLPVVLSDEASISARRNGKPDTPLSAREAWLENSLAWYQDANNFDVLLAASGPKEWPRVRNAEQPIERVPTQRAIVSDISTSDDRISFHVDRVGVPVLVRASYFPNWQSSGAGEVYRVTPNLMVVVPTSQDVTLHYGHTPVDLLGWAMTGLGVVGAIALFRVDRRLVTVPRRRRPERGLGADADEPTEGYGPAIPLDIPADGGSQASVAVGGPAATGPSTTGAASSSDSDDGARPTGSSPG